MALASFSARLAFGQSTAPTTSPAPPSQAIDSIALRDGTILRGHVTVMRPQTDVTIVLLDGTSRTVAWSDIRSSEGPAFAFASGTSQPQAPVLPPAPPAAPLELDLRDPAPGRVPLVLESIGPRLVIGETFGMPGFGARLGTGHHEVCFTPCTLYVRPGLFPLYIAGDGILPAAVRLEVPPTGMRARLRAPRSWAFGALLGFEALTLVAAATGVEFLLLQPRPHAGSPPDNTFRDAAIVLISLGATGFVADLIGFGFALRNGVDSSEPLVPRAQARRVRFGAAATRDGALAAVGGEF